MTPTEPSSRSVGWSLWEENIYLSITCAPELMHPGFVFVLLAFIGRGGMRDVVGVDPEILPVPCGGLVFADPAGKTLLSLSSLPPNLLTSSSIVMAFSGDGNCCPTSKTKPFWDEDGGRKNGVLELLMHL